jgi:hypothetical protein
MGTNNSHLELGIIICQYCGKMLGTQDTEKVTTYYGICNPTELCEPAKIEQGEIKYEW